MKKRKIKINVKDIPKPMFMDIVYRGLYKTTEDALNENKIKPCYELGMKFLSSIEFLSPKELRSLRKRFNQMKKIWGKLDNGRCKLMARIVTIQLKETMEDENEQAR